MKQNNLLFSKRNKADKGTSMGEENNNIKGVFGIPQSPSKASNSKNKNKKEEVETNKNKNKNNEKKIQKVADDYLKNTTSNNRLAILQKETNKLKEKIKSLEEKISKERNDLIKEINQIDEETKKNNTTIKKLSTQFNKQIEVLKKYEENLIIKTKKRSRDKTKSNEEIEKDIKLIEAQIKVFEKRANLYEEDYNLSVKRAEKKENTENELQETLNELNEEISSLKEVIQIMKETDVEHKHCKYNNKKLLEKFKAMNKAYEYELKMAKLLALSEITDEKEEKNGEDNEIEEEEDNETKAVNDEKNILPRIQNLKFSPGTDAALESKIIRKNQIGITHNKSNSINLYKKLSSEFNNNNDRYILEANKNIRINQSNGSIRTEGNFLFKDYENNLLKRIIPIKMINNYKDKFNTLLKHKNEMHEKFKNESCDMKHENLLINNKKDFNTLKIKETNRRNILLSFKSHKLKEKVNLMKKNIKDIIKEIKKEEEKLKRGEKEAKRIEIYFKELSSNTKKTKNPVNET